jgi:RimJ/RimL family protein N-acetyltransferase
VIETPRLILRGWRDADYEPFAALNADPEVMRHFPSLLSREESDGAANRLRLDIDDHGWGLWAVERKDDGAFMGFTGLQRPRPPHPLQDDVEIGWRLARWSWGHGYASEAARASLDFGFNELGLSRIVSFTIAANERSQAVMRRLGMTRAPELDFEHPAIPEGHPMRPHVVYVISRLG